MPVTSDIVRTWRAPREVARDLLNRGKREDRAIAFVMIACFLIFVAQWPRLSRISSGFEPSPWPEDVNMEGMMTYTFYAVVIMLPLALYGLAALTRIIGRAVGASVSWYAARLVFFWTLLATTPLLLLHGLVRGFIGPGFEANLVGALWLLAFALIWFLSFKEAARG
ncbi:hypothetical protein [Yoonia sp. 2307UL14-13]|uniref:hypothetical protein n=1 Tax=Yoonia sp. 2307UL14-13 TaxID=3126506 RepID=UPI00309794BF